MELDVHLTREGEEPWGFDFIGGADCGIPLTIDKVFPSSPAQTAGLQPGDVVARLGDKLANELSQEAARAVVAEAVGSLSFGICRGLYDPVLDNFEPIYEPIDRADSDLRSEPTEVQFPIQQFDPNELSLDDPNILDPRITDPSLWDSGYMTRPITESRSLTASPFIPNTKPYRPFSTEPLEVPPLDDPIILNPNYTDTIDFNNNLAKVELLKPEEDELVRILPLGNNIEAKFKLPVSEKYDPDWDKKVKVMLKKCVEGGRRETQHVEHELVYYAGKAKESASNDFKSTQVKEKDITVAKGVKIKEEKTFENLQMTKEEVKFEERIVNENDGQNIEQIALDVVEESIERAVSVTEEIKKEIEEEMRASMTRELQEVSEVTSEMKMHTEEIESEMIRKELGTKDEVTESVEHESKILEEKKQKTHTEMTVTENEEILIKDQQFVEERSLSTKTEMEEMIETGKVKRKSSAFDKEERVSSTEIEENIKEQVLSRKVSTQHELEESISNGTVNKQSMAFEKAEDVLPKKEVNRKILHNEERRSERVKDSSSAFSTETLQSESKQKAYMIGLQTIPHIKGFVQSSYHFDLLLRTFFVHLTDVMVALSRFILTRPSTELEGKAEKVIKEKLIKEFDTQNITQYKTDHKQEGRKQSENIKHTVLQEKDFKKATEAIQTKQETKVTKARVNESMQLEHQQIKEVQQLKQDTKKSEDIKTQQEVTVVKGQNKEKTSFEMNSEELDTRKVSGAEMAQRTQRKSKDLTKKMDAVITEFESKTGIEDRLEVTEQSRRRSRSRSQIEEEVIKESDPLEWLDKVDSRRASQERTDIAIVKKEYATFSECKESKKSETKRESSSTKVKPGKQMYVAIVESHVYTNDDAILEDQVTDISETASMQSSEEINAALETSEAISTENVAMTNVIQSEEKQQAVEVISNALQEVVKEKQEILETISDFSSGITEQHSKSVMHESHTSVAAESTEIISESKVETFKAEELKERKAVTVQEEIYKTAAVEFVDVPLEATKEVIESKASTHQAVSKVESLAIAVAESTDFEVDDSKLETFESKKLISQKAKVTSEETFKKAAVGTADVTFEVAEDKHSELTKASQATIREEGQYLAVAGIIETKTELCKEPIKPAEDEYASLKIVKEQVIDGGESVEISESELNVKQSVDIEMSSSQHIQSSISKESYQSTETSSSVQESFHSSKSKLQIRTDLAQQVLQRQTSDQSDENINTPTPSTVPPTPLTDEYVFKLELPLPKNHGTVVVESPEDEDPNIVKKRLVPHIETTIEEQIIYDPPLPTPPMSPVYTKPGLKGGAEPLMKKDEHIQYNEELKLEAIERRAKKLINDDQLEYIREIERKSSLLASAIDQTIKSIEEYKEEVGIDKNEVTIKLKKKALKIGEETKMTNGYHTNGLTNGHQENESNTKEWAEVDIQENNENVQKLSKENQTKVVNGNAVSENGVEDKQRETDALPGFKPVVFNPEAFQARLYEEVIRGTEPEPIQVKPYVNESGQPLGTMQGIVDGLEEATVDEEVAKELGKPGLTEDKIAVLISGESEMLREAHVMGLSRVITSHMTRADDSSVDFQKIKPLVESLKDSEVLKALNEEILREMEAKKKEEKKWTTFLQKPKRPVPRAKFGYFGNVEPEEVELEEPYTVKIVKQPKPKVAPDYKPEDFDTGPLPWEERALKEPVPSPVPPEDPILIPEEVPEFLEAVDPLPESEVPDLEDTGIPLPPSPISQPEESILPPEESIPPPEPQEPPPDPPKPEVEEPPEMHDMDQNKMAEQLVNTVKSMVDPNASLEQQLAQMRAQLDALAQLPCVIQQSLEMLTRQLSTMSRQETHQMSYETQMNMESHQQIQEYHVQNNQEATESQEGAQNQQERHTVTIEEVQETPTVTAEEIAAKKREEDAFMEEQRRSEKEKKGQQEKARLDQESRQIKQRAPRVGKPKPVFGPLTPEERPLVLPGGRRWRGPKDAYNEQMIAETLQAQSEMLQGKVLGYESDLLPYDNRINFMKYEKPPVNLDHLQNSATYKLIHNMEQEPMRRVDLRTPVVAEADYRERCRSATPNMQANGRM